MGNLKYVLKRLLLMFFTFFAIVTICFMLIRLLPHEMPQDKNMQEVMKARWEALGYYKPLLVQFGIYLKNIVTEGDFGTSWYVSYNKPAMSLIIKNLLPTVLVNLYSMIISTPIGLALGVLAAIKKNKWIDHVISTGVMIFVSVPSYVYAFIVQWLFYFKLEWFPQRMYAIADVGRFGPGEEWLKSLTPDFFTSGAFLAEGAPEWWQQLAYFTPKMTLSMALPVLALSFGTIAGLTRFTRAELTETLTSEYMLLARTKGLTRAQATTRHALKNAMVPILPMILSGFIGILGGSMIIEQIFSIPGVGQLYIKAVTLLDYDVFMADTIFYTFIGLLSGIVVDISYGFIDPRIRMGEK